MRALTLPSYYGHSGRPARPSRPSRPYRTPRPHPVSIIPIHDDPAPNPETNHVTGHVDGDVPSFGPVFDNRPFVVLRPLRPGTGYVSGSGLPPVRPVRPSRPLGTLPPPSRPGLRPDPDADSNHIDRPQRPPHRPSSSSADASKSAARASRPHRLTAEHVWWR